MLNSSRFGSAWVIVIRIMYLNKGNEVKMFAYFLTLSDPSTYIYVSYLTAVATRVRKYTYSKFHL